MVVKPIFIFVVFLLTSTVCIAQVALPTAQWVDPFIGTAGDRGQMHPAATLPFGMVQMGPETPGRPHSGYDFNSNTIEGFAHTRQSGVGCRGSGGSILVRADYIGESNDKVFKPVLLHKSSESASVGYYQAAYGESNVRAEMTVSPSSGWQRYHFPKDGKIVLNIDVAHAHHENYDGDYKFLANGEVLGRVSGPTVCKLGRFQFYFSLRTDRVPAETREVSQYHAQLIFDVEKGDKIVVQTGISSVSHELAKQARLKDAKVGGFDKVLAQAKVAWEQVLSKITIDSDNTTKTLFYSHLYQLYQSPSNLTATLEQYRGSDNKVYTVRDSDYYFGWSIWDNFRTQLPLLTLLEPDVMMDITASLAKLHFQNKQNWATQYEPLPTVRTEHAIIVLLDAWQKGIQAFDLKALLPKLAEDADQMPRKSPDQILEAAYDDWAVAKFAELVDEHEIAREYRRRAAEYRETWIDKFKEITDKSDVMHGVGLYEGTLWQYRWFVPFDSKWLIDQLDGDEGFNEQLQYFFDKELFNIGNQPDIQTPFMFNFVGQAWRSQALLHGLLHKETRHWYGTHDKKDKPYIGRVFQAEPEGLIPEMDNDAGTMSGWYVFAMLGLYPALPGEPIYTLHTPQLKNISIALANGKTLSIQSDKDPVENPFIESVKLNGKTLSKAWVSHQKLSQGARLEFTLSNRPNKNWAKNNLYKTSL